MAPHSSTFAQKIPWTEEPGRLQSMGSVESDRTERLHFHFSLFMNWRRKWQPTPVFLPGESQGWGSLVGCRLWGHTESDTTEATQQQQQQTRIYGLPRWLSGKESACNARYSEIWDRIQDWEDPLEEEMATNSCSIAQKVPWGVSKESNMTERLNNKTRA